MKQIRSKWFEKHNGQIWLEYGILALLILGPMLIPGYILTLDLVFTPHIAWPSEVSNAYPLQAVLWLLHQVLPVDIIEKIILWSIIILSGAGMHLLVKTRWGEYVNESTVAPYVAGLFYAINPFTYSRFMAGQWMVLLGYALLPFFVAALLKWLSTPSRRGAVITGLWIFGIISVSIHQSLIVPFVAAAAIGVHGIKTRKITTAYLEQMVILLVMPLCLSGFWVVPATFGKGAIAESVASFDHSHFQAFATAGGGVLGSLGEVLRLQGFWADVQQLYVLPQQKIPLWGILWIVLWIVIGIGYAAIWRANKRHALFIAVLFTGGVFVAVTPFFEWIGQSVPAAQGLREPHKFAMLVAFTFAVCSAFGVAALQRRLRKRYGEYSSQVAGIVVILFVFLITPTSFWGFSGQLQPRQYPEGWMSMNTYMKERTLDEKILFLPWHQYANYSFSGRIIANPAEKFFENSVIISDEPDFRDVSPTRPNPEKRAISLALKNKDKAALTSSGVQYVLLAKEQRYQEYDWLVRQAVIEKDADGIVLLNIGGKNG